MKLWGCERCAGCRASVLRDRGIQRVSGCKYGSERDGRVKGYGQKSEGTPLRENIFAQITPLKGEGGKAGKWERKGNHWDWGSLCYLLRLRCHLHLGFALSISLAAAAATPSFKFPLWHIHWRSSQTWARDEKWHFFTSDWSQQHLRPMLTSTTCSQPLSHTHTHSQSYSPCRLNMLCQAQNQKA